MVRALSLLLLCMCLSGCAQDEDEWERLKRESTESLAVQYAELVARLPINVDATRTFNSILIADALASHIHCYPGDFCGFDYYEVSLNEFSCTQQRPGVVVYDACEFLFQSGAASEIAMVVTGVIAAQDEDMLIRLNVEDSIRKTSFELNGDFALSPERFTGTLQKSNERWSTSTAMELEFDAGCAVAGGFTVRSGSSEVTSVVRGCGRASVHLN